jgi:hypothetical protein
MPGITGEHAAQKELNAYETHLRDVTAVGKYYQKQVQSFQANEVMI